MKESVRLAETSAMKTALYKSALKHRSVRTKLKFVLLQSKKTSEAYLARIPEHGRKQNS